MICLIWSSIPNSGESRLPIAKMELKKPWYNENLHLRLGMLLMGFLLLAAAAALLLGPFSIQLDLDHRGETPSAVYPLGTDNLGRDLLSCTIYGTGISLLIAAVVVTLSFFTGAILGMVSGMAGGIIDSVIMRIVDILLAFPGILLAIAMAAFIDHGLLNLILVLTLPGWVDYARIARAEVLKQKQNQFILAARLYNASFLRIIFHHLFPLVLPLLLVQASLGISGIIIAESSLNFLGIGLDPGTPTLGQLIDTGRDHMFDNPLLIVVPGVALFVLIMAVNLIGEGIRRRISSRSA